MSDYHISFPSDPHFFFRQNKKIFLATDLKVTLYLSLKAFQDLLRFLLSQIFVMLSEIL